MERGFVQAMAEAVEARIPDGYGFVVMAFPLEGQGDGRLVYASNGRREDVVAALKEFLLRCGAAEDWMRHLE
jgi:hypothetical protein